MLATMNKWLLSQSWYAPNLCKKVIILQKNPQTFNTTHQLYGAQQKYYQGNWN